MRILLVEDDEILIEMLLSSLTRQHYIVDTVEDGQTGLEYAQSASYDLLLIDVGLPKLDGITLCQRLRSVGYKTPILLMTAKDASSDRIRGLDAGADDYLIKPLDLEELQARVRALLRRGEVSPTPVLQVGSLRLDPRSYEVSYGEKLLTLTPKEYSLLELFLRNPSRVFSRGQIVEHLWTFDDPPLEESVKAHIKGLRMKLKAAGAFNWIENVYGIGYRLREGVGEEEASGAREAGEERQSYLSPSAKPHNSELRTQKSRTVEQQFNQAKEALWEQYRGLMAQRLAVLQEAATALQAGTLSEGLRQEAGRAAHKLAGVLGMFERDAGTLVAQELETLLEDSALLSARESQLQKLVKELGELLDLAEPKSFPPPLGTPNRGDETPIPPLFRRATEEQAPAEQHQELSLLPNPAHLLLIDPDPTLNHELQELELSARVSWKRVATLKAAKIWLQSHSPDLVVLDIEAVGQKEKSLALLAELTNRTPSVPVLVLASADELWQRVTVARSGGQLLVKPVTATQVWEIATQLLHQTRSLKANVLVVDDDPIFLAALHLILEPWGIRMTGLDNPLRFCEVLQATAPDLLILDVEMPQLGGIELCQTVRTDPYWQSLPILFLTAHRDRQTIQQMFAAGADDYVTKPIVGPELLTRITNRLERTRLLQNLCIKDPLTGLANQPQSYRDLEYLIEQAQLQNSPLCLAVLTVVELRQFNIEYGHAVGNQILQRLGRLLQAAFRGTEVLGYWGNGEFVVGMPGLTKVEAGDRFSEFQTTLRQQVFTSMDGSRFQASFCQGIAEYPTDGLTLQSLYQVMVNYCNSWFRRVSRFS
jgi:diguanylate cyclase (GGDEF)-like protein